MKYKFLSISVVILSIFLLGGCSSVSEMEESTNRKDQNAGTVSFQLGGSASTDDITRTEEDELTVAEKSVKSLYAIIFKSNEEHAFYTSSNPTLNDGKEDDKFVRCENLSNFIEDGKFSFELPSACFNICLVANADDELISKLTSFKGSMADFKKITTSTPLNTDKGLLMVSDFYGIKVNYGAVSDLGTVMMQRAMARIDIENLAEEVTITSAVLKCQKKDTYLYRQVDNSIPENTNDNYSEKDSVLNLDFDNKASAAFYSYENLNPSSPLTLTLNYTFDGENYSHVVDLKKKSGEILSLERNHLYTVSMTNKSDIEVTVTSSEWTNGDVIETVDVNSVQYNVGIVDYAHAKVGDFMLKDGRIISRENVSLEHKPDIVGMVALLYKDCPELWPDDNSHGGFNHGLVLSARDCNEGEEMMWGPARYLAEDFLYYLYDEETPLENFNTPQESYDYAIDGYADWEIMESFISEHDNYEVWQSIKSTRDLANSSLISNTSNWYLPSRREIIEILRELTTEDSTCGGSYHKEEYEQGCRPLKFNNETNFLALRYGYSLPLSMSNVGYVHRILNSWFEDVLINQNQKDYKIFDQFKSRSCFWLSSEANIGVAWNIEYMPTAITIGRGGKNNKAKVRCILAF